MSNPPSFNESLIQAFIRLIAKHTGIEIRDRDKNSLCEKLASRIKSLNLDSSERYYQILSSLEPLSHQEWQNLVTLITNIETYFFRDQEQFSLLRDHILPELIERKQNNKTIRICSAGCSSGEEPYSLAILLKELLPDLDQWNLTILGIDINQGALQKAQKGTYRPWSFRRVDQEIVQRYFKLIKNQYHIDSSIKRMVEFRLLNLFNEHFFSSKSGLQELDLILCRNVFIYFEPLAIAKVLRKFYNALNPLGYLITGHAELYGQDLSQFQTKIFSESVVYQRLSNKSLGTPHQVYLPSAQDDSSPEKLSRELNNGDLVNALEKNNVKMQQVALNLLKQLPPETQMPKMGNLTAAELIEQLETALKEINQGFQ